MGDVNTYRTVAQVRCLSPTRSRPVCALLGGTSYDKALAEERQGVKDFGTTYGEIPKTALEITGALATLPIGMGAASTAARASAGRGQACGTDRSPSVARFYRHRRGDGSRHRLRRG